METGPAGATSDWGPKIVILIEFKTSAFFRGEGVKNLPKLQTDSSKKLLTRRLRSVNFKMSFWCHLLDQNTNEIFSRISALPSKKMLNQKNKGTLYT